MSRMAPLVFLLLLSTMAGAAEDAAKGEAPSVRLPVASKYFANVQDGYESAEEQEELVNIPLEAMGDILATLKAATPKQIEDAVTPDVTFKMLMKEPSKYRGMVVQLAGVLRFLRKVGIENNASGVTQAWEGQVSNAEGNITTFISLEALPENLAIGHGVRLSGVFLKRHGYLNREPGEKLTICPLMFVQHVEPWSELRHGSGGPSAPVSFSILEALLSIFALIVLVAVFYGRSMKKAQTANVFSKKKERLAPKQGVFPKPEAPKPAPGTDSGKA
ncbi:MAG: hypothetical protein KIS92_05295 [Planctomycetota bacterium]|nr:hypothetical protein [Planctomycetota bacterium]